jgi:hypothetical protein
MNQLTDDLLLEVLMRCSGADTVSAAHQSCRWFRDVVGRDTLKIVLSVHGGDAVQAFNAVRVSNFPWRVRLEVLYHLIDKMPQGTDRVLGDDGRLQSVGRLRAAEMWLNEFSEEWRGWFDTDRKCVPVTVIERTGDGIIVWLDKGDNGSSWAVPVVPVPEPRSGNRSQKLLLYALMALLLSLLMYHV